MNAVNEQSNEVFLLYSQYYDLLYADKNYASEINYVENLLSENKIFSGSILELGSGTGKHAKLLASKGFHVTGVEKSEEMLKRAEQSDLCKFLLGDIANFHIAQKFDVVISLFHVISYITSDSDLENLFKQTSQHLKDGGLFIFDIWYSPCVSFNQPKVRVKKIDNDEVEITRIAEPIICDEKNLVDVMYTIFSKNKNTDVISCFKELHSMRHFSTPEISLLAKINGLELIKSEEFLTGKPPGKDTWGVCFVLRKLTKD